VLRIHVHSRNTQPHLEVGLMILTTDVDMSIRVFMFEYVRLVTWTSFYVPCPIMGEGRGW